VFHLVSIVLLVLVLRYGKGGAGSPVERWFVIGGVAIQPSEFAKYTLVMAVAFYFRDGRRVGDVGLLRMLPPLLMMIVPFLLIVRQPDLGSGMLVALAFIPMIVMAGIRMRLLVSFAALGLAAVLLLVAAFQFGTYRVDRAVLKTLAAREVPDELIIQARSLEGQRFWTAGAMRGQITQRLLIAPNEPSLDVLEEAAFRPFISHLLRPYQQKRLLTFVNPGADPLGAGYHVIQSRVAIGSGRFLGKGFGESTQGSLNFLPARHTDFIFAIFAEERGFLGVLLLAGLYGALIVRGYSIIFQTRDRFSAFLALGIVSVIGLQALVNVSMAAGVMPVVGVPLPLFSYGGSSMVTTLAGIAMLLNVRMRRFLWG
jgi:rod shape determining protein RodA